MRGPIWHDPRFGVTGERRSSAPTGNWVTARDSAGVLRTKRREEEDVD